MTKNQVSQALTIARSSQSLQHIDETPLDGYALKSFQPKPTTIEVVAKVLRLQTVNFNGTIDQEQLELFYHNKHKFIIL